jgi:hypothetical protein
MPYEPGAERTLAPLATRRSLGRTACHETGSRQQTPTDRRGHLALEHDTSGTPSFIWPGHHG